MFCFKDLPLILSCKGEREKRNNKDRPEKGRFGRDFPHAQQEQGGLDLRSPRRPFLECPLWGTGNPWGRMQTGSCQGLGWGRRGGTACDRASVGGVMLWNPVVVEVAPRPECRKCC